MKCEMSIRGSCPVLLGGFCLASGLPCYDEILKLDKPLQVVTLPDDYIKK